MEGQSSQASEALFDPITKISQSVNEKDQKLIENEALIIYTKLEINKIQTATKELDEQSRNLKIETELFQKEIGEVEISIDINRKSLEVKSDVQIYLKQEISRLEIEIQDQTKRCETVYSEYLEKYKKARNVYETYHPLFTQLKQLQNENLKLEVQFKILRAKFFEKKKQIKLRREYHRQIFNATVVKFSESTLNYWKARDVARDLEKAEQEETSLVQQLHDVEVLAVKMDKELRQIKRTTVSNETSKIKNTEFMADQNWNELNSNNINHNVVIPPAPTFTSLYSTSFNPLDNPCQSEDMLLQIRARCDQRQHQWEKQRSSSSTSLKRKQRLPSTNRSLKQQKSVLGQALLHSQKHSLQPPNLPNHSSQFKIPKTASTYNVTGNENLPFINQQAIQKLPPISTGIENPIFQQSKAKIISVHNIRGNENSISLNQQPLQKPLMPQDINKNFNQVLSQQTSQYLSRPSQNYPPPNIVSRVQSQEMNVTVGTPKQQSQFYHPENLLSKEMNKNTSTRSGSMNKGAAQGPLEYIAQPPLNYRSENVVSQSQSSIPQNITQEISRSKADSIDPYAMTQFQSGATPNLNRMLLSGNQATLTQASNNSGNNTGGTSQSSTFSQKCMEMQHYLDRQFQEPVFTPPPAPQIKATRAVEPVRTSPFFNKPKPGEITEFVTQPHDNMAAQEPLSRNENDENIEMSPPNMNQYLDTSGLFNNEGEYNVTFEDDYPQLLSPDCDENSTSAAEPIPQSDGFSFNFAQPQTKKAGETRFSFSNNPATASNPFSNMFH